MKYSGSYERLAETDLIISKKLNLGGGVVILSFKIFTLFYLYFLLEKFCFQIDTLRVMFKKRTKTQLPPHLTSKFPLLSNNKMHTYKQIYHNYVASYFINIRSAVLSIFSAHRQTEREILIGVT